MNVSAIIVTRGDVPMQAMLDSLPDEWQKIVWWNGSRMSGVKVYGGATYVVGNDLAVYGRYAAIKHASHDVIYVQDDDCIVSDPQAIVDAFLASRALYTDCICIHGNAITPGCPSCDAGYAPFVVCNMPERFRHDFYSDHALVGFGAAFHRDAPGRAFRRFFSAAVKYRDEQDFYITRQDRVFERTCDVVFTGLTPRVLVDVPYFDASYASDPGRMWKQPGHGEERGRMLELVRKVLDAS